MTWIADMDIPGEMAALAVADELTVHGWDLSRATGQPYDCDPAALNAALSFLGRFASPDAPACRTCRSGRPGRWPATHRCSIAWSPSPGGIFAGHRADPGAGRSPPGPPCHAAGPALGWYPWKCACSAPPA